MFKEYFLFTTGQRRAILFLCSLILLLTLLNFLLPYFIHPKETIPNNELKQMMAKIQLDSNNNNKNYANEKYVFTKLTPYNFNPNTLDSVGFIKLGLKEKLVHTIINYRNKGGHYYNKDGFKKMYGLHEEEYIQLENFISIPEEKKFATTYTKEKLHIDIATADTALLNKLNGIGNKLAQNIVIYREKLGGFVRVDQLKEVWGISTETFEKIKKDCYCTSSHLHKINLNEATLAEINIHPYLQGDIAKAIVVFRKEHNYKIENLNQLKEIQLINEEIFRKIVPYLSL